MLDNNVFIAKFAMKRDDKQKLYNYLMAPHCGAIGLDKERESSFMLKASLAFRHQSDQVRRWRALYLTR